MELDREIRDLLKNVPRVEDWKSRIDIDKVKYLIRNQPKDYRMSQKKTTALLNLLTEGTRPPKEFLEERGFSADNFRDPIQWMNEVAEGDPNAYIAFLEQRKKMLTVGALAGPLPNGMDSKIYGKSPMPMPEFVIQEGPEKFRVIMDFSAIPRGKGPTNDRSERWTANSGFEKAETGCSFPDIRDKAAFIAAFGEGWASLVDIKAMFWQMKQHRSVLHYQVIPLKLPGDTVVRLYVLMGNAMGTSGAPAGCVSLHILLLDLADRIKKGTMMTNEYSRPDTYGLAVETGKSWKDFLVHRPPHIKTKSGSVRVHRNDHSWVYLRGEFYGRWKTGDIMLMLLLHMDDANLGGFRIKLNREATRHLLKFYVFINLLVSTKHPSTPTRTPILTGHLAIMPDKLIGFTDERWGKVWIAMQPVFRDEEATVEDLLKLAGLLNHLADLFFHVRIYFTPMSRWLGFLNTICNTDKRKWKNVMGRTTKVPAPLRALILDGWRALGSQRWTHVRDLLHSEADATLIVSTDASGESEEFPAGMGAVVHWASNSVGKPTVVAGTKTMIVIPRNHPLASRPIACIELFCSVYWIIKTCRYGEIVILFTDNEPSRFWIQKWRAKPLYSALMMILANHAKKMNIKVIAKRLGTHDIPADPLSRWMDPKSEGEWIERASRFSVPLKGPTVEGTDWRDLWKEMIALEED